MANDYQELKDSLVKLSDEQLIEIALSTEGEYRQDALEIARNELKWRSVEIPKPEEDESAVEPVSTDPTRIVRPAIPDQGCPFCGGRFRPGTLVAEKELTIIFSDNQEERFVRVNVCTQCGQLSLAVDLETVVEP
ncbi:MAG TPA: hypothetical protein VGK48_19725 [Terriglobia bacterium]|jgi:hypothetical protein